MSKGKVSLRPSRVFSEAVKRQAVQAIESGKMSVSGICRQLGVSYVAVYKWLNKYSRHLQSGHQIVVQMESEQYKSLELERRIKELEAALGRKQLEVDFLNQMIEQGKKELGVDLKKKFSTPPSNGSGTTGSSTGTK